MKTIQLAFLLSLMLCTNIKADFSPVSLIKLTVTPHKFEGKSILVSGYLVFSEGDPPSLYLNKDASLMHSSDYLVLDQIKNEELIFNKCKLGCFASFVGVFEYSKFNSPKSFIGVIEKISRSVVENN